MVSAGQGDETGTGDASGQLAPGLEWNHEVVAHMHDKRRHPHSEQKVSDIEIAADIKIPSSALGRGRFQLQFIEIVRLLVRSPRNEPHCEYLPKARIICAPSKAHQ